jgi:tripartite-type tricarboxylate transporter receptor subunit TctC
MSKPVVRRRAFARALAVTFLASSTLVTAIAQPAMRAEPITLLVGSNAGGTTDITARLLAEGLSRDAGRLVLVQNRPGASGSVAAQEVVRARADGSTLLVQVSAFHVITPAISKQPWDPIRDFKPVAHVLRAPTVIAVRSELPIRSLKELVDYARNHPSKLTYPSAGTGSMPHVSAVLFEQATGTQLLHVPYKGAGGSAVTDLLGGRLDVAFFSASPILQFVRSGKLRALAVTGSSRVAALPDVPSTQESGFPGLDASYWFGLYAPARTPSDVVDKIAADVQRVVDGSEFKAAADAQGAEALFLGPVPFAKFTHDELTRWSSVVRKAGITAE